MKTVIVGLVLSMLGTYPKTMTATEVNYKANTVICADYNGNTWAFTGCDDWQDGDIVSAIMSDNETPDNIYDDVIISARYSGRR